MKPRRRVFDVMWYKRHGGWIVVARNEKLLKIWAKTKRDAIHWGAQQCRRSQPSQLIIRKRDGHFQSERTYPRSSDPKRRKG